MEIEVAKKAKKKIVRREYTKADVKELRSHPKAKTPLATIMKLIKRTEVHCVRRRATLASVSGIGDNGRGKQVRLLSPDDPLSRAPKRCIAPFGDHVRQDPPTSG
jgi:hypothetical protein